MSKRTDIEAELTRLRSAAAPKIAGFAARRAERIAELEAALLATPEEVPADPKTEAALRSTRGGDRFDRRR